MRMLNTKWAFLLFVIRAISLHGMWNAMKTRFLSFSTLYGVSSSLDDPTIFKRHNNLLSSDHLLLLFPIQPSLPLRSNHFENFTQLSGVRNGRSIHSDTLNRYHHHYYRWHTADASHCLLHNISSWLAAPTVFVCIL